jgi:glycerol-3-phosphate acyltransferase PlsY
VLFQDNGRMLFLVLILTVLIYIRHAANLARIKAGTEPKIGRKKA